jgi:hypothetical protein
MQADDSKNKRISPAKIMGIIILVIGLLVAVLQSVSINNRVFWNDQSDLLGILCWTAVGMAIELFGIGLIMADNRK